ncbi:MAG: cyclodeaminase/cyclohydrolase family protein [candidate division WOR-3 bacterium]
MDILISDFIERLSSSSPTPGGGSVTALLGAFSSSLTMMVGNLTYGKKKYEEAWDKAKEVIDEAKNLNEEFLLLFYEDMEAFTKLLASFSLPRETEEEKKRREEEIEKATKKAIEVPLKVMEKSKKCLELTLIMAKIGNLNAISDVGIAGEIAFSACKSASFNVLINLKFLKDSEYSLEIEKRQREILDEVRALKEEIESIVIKKIK